MNTTQALPEDLRHRLDDSLKQLNRILLGKEREIRLVMTCLLADGHILLEDLPGTGKTLTAQSVAKVTGLDLQRVQGTNDLLPGDLIGTQVFYQSTEQFQFVQGPLFTALLLVDEINRMPPKSQSALLEAMEERRVSIDGESKELPNPFWVIATQNPHGQVGTFALPEAQLDRFLMCLSLGYPDKPSEAAILAGEDRRLLLEKVPDVLSVSDILSLRQAVLEIHASESLIDYILRLVEYTRISDAFNVGLSTRAAQSLLRAARAWALLRGDDKVLPADVQQVFVSVATHRLCSTGLSEGNLTKVNQVLQAIDV